MRGNIKYTKWQSIKYALQWNFLINNFLESFFWYLDKINTIRANLAFGEHQL